MITRNDIILRPKAYTRAPIFTYHPSPGKGEDRVSDKPTYFHPVDQGRLTRSSLTPPAVVMGDRHIPFMQA